MASGQGSGHKNSSLVPALWPDKIHRQGLRAVLRATARFLQVKGYWPLTKEMASFLHAPLYATMWYIDDLIDRGYLERIPRYGGNHGVRVSPLGWQSLRMVPIEPWSPRPGRKLKSRVMREVALSIQRKQQNFSDAQGAQNV